MRWRMLQRSAIRASLLIRSDIITMCPRASTRALASMMATAETEGVDQLTTNRVPLSRVFDGERNYLFSMKTNVRSYEWGVDEAETLLSDVRDSLDAAADDADAYELNSVILVRGKSVPKQGQFYDVHDGQQRIVTLSLILAAMRDRYLQLDDPEMAMELQKKLRPDKPRQERVLRVLLRKQESELFERILDRAGGEGEMGPAVKLPTTKERKALRDAEQRVADNFEAIKQSVDEIDKAALDKLFDYLMDHCFVMFSESPTSKMARSLVMGQNRGKNIEAIDEFKGKLIFGGVTGETQQDRCL